MDRHMQRPVRIRKHQGERPWLAVFRWIDHTGKEQFETTAWKNWKDATDYGRLSLQWIPS